MSDHIWTINGFKVDAETMCRHLIRELARRDEQIAAVRVLHTSRQIHSAGGFMNVRCFACDNTYPCPTIRKLDGAS